MYEQKKKELIGLKWELEKKRKEALKVDRFITNDEVGYKACFGNWELFKTGKDSSPIDS